MALLFILRGVLFRYLINYNVVSSRAAIEISNQRLIDKINAKSIDKTIDLETLTCIANAITCEMLSFTNGKASANPNQLLQTQRANCVGYAAMLNSIANYLIQKHQLPFASKHQVAKLDLLGLDLHQFFNSSFFKDHDFNEIIDLDTGAKVSIDASVSDYLWIDRVSVNE